MGNTTETMHIFRQIVMSGRIVLTTMIICCVFYTLIILGVGQVFVAYTANGSLLHNEQGTTVGSEAIAQGFSRPEYFWPRPSAVDYNGAATGGSNLSPASPKLRKGRKPSSRKWQLRGQGGNLSRLPRRSRPTWSRLPAAAWIRILPCREPGISRQSCLGP